jgi:exopolyphosphatase/guanosine-5'-triphosphate,3'-diphosphate pyrophosphatase
MSRKAAIDLGSNSIKLLVLDVDEQLNYKVVHDEAVVTGLGRNLVPGGLLDEESCELTVEVVKRFAKTALELGVPDVVSAGTAAMRRAGNGKQFVDELNQLTGLEIRIISGEREAAIASEVAVRELTTEHEHVVLFDTGGGSTELSWFQKGELKGDNSIQLGARYLTDELNITHPVSEEMRDKLTHHILSQLPDNAVGPHRGGELVAGAVKLAGLGGTASLIVWLLQGIRGQERSDPHLTEVTAAQLALLLERLARSNMEEVLQMKNMNPDRASVVYAGVSIIRGLLRHYGVESFTLTDRGLRYGLLLSEIMQPSGA